MFLITRMCNTGIPHLHVGAATVAVMSGAHTLMSSTPAAAVIVVAPDAGGLAPHAPAVFNVHVLYFGEVGNAYKKPRQ